MLAVAGGALGASGQSGGDGAISGKLTDLHSTPLRGATIILRNLSTGQETRAVTSKNGSYRLAGLPAGAYRLEAVTEGKHGSIDGLAVTAGYEAHVQTAVALEPGTSAELADAGQRQLAIPVPVTSATRPGNSTVTASAEPIPAELPRAHEVQAPEPALAAVPGVRIAPQTLAVAELRAVPAVPAVLVHPRAVAAIPAEFLRVGGATLALAAAAQAWRTLQDASTRAALEAARTSADVPDNAAEISGEQLRQLPLSGRDWAGFLGHDAAEPNRSAEDGEETPGARTPQTDVAVDGMNTALAFGSRADEQPARRRSGAMAESAVEDVQVMSSPAMTSGAMQEPEGRISTRHGSNQLHGQLFLFTRQNFGNAQNPASQWVKETTPGTATTVPVFTGVPFSPSDRKLDWGAGMGGALRKNRIFWFTALDASWRDNPGVAMVRHPENFFAQPSNDEMQVLSARLGLTGNNPVGEGVQAYSKLLESLAGLLGPEPRTARQWTGFARLDWRAGERNRFTVEGTGDAWDSPGGGFTRLTESYGNHSFGASHSIDSWLLGRWETFITPNLLAVTQGSVGRRVFSTPAATPSAFENSLNSSVWGQLPQIAVDSRYGFTIGNPARFGAGSDPEERQYAARVSVDWIRGPWLVKSGVELRHSSDATSLVPNHTGTYHYTSVENFAGDALSFLKFGMTDVLDPMHQHNCDPRQKAWRDTTGQLHGLGYLPCYSYYTQTMGPTRWNLSTNDFAAYQTFQWQAAKQLVISAALRWDREQLPPPMALVNNPDLPLTQKMPSLGDQWGPRVSAAWGHRGSRWPVLRMGYGLYFGRTTNAVLETALTQTGSQAGDLNFMMRPTDNLNRQGGGGAPPFPYVLAGEPAKFQKPGAVEFAPRFRNPEIHQAMAGIEQDLPGHILLRAGAEVSLARRLPVTVDTNFDPSTNPGTITYNVVDPTGKGPLKVQKLTVPFFASWPAGSVTAGRLNPDYQQITQLMSRANSTYEAAVVQAVRSARRGVAFHARYTYAHAMDWNPNESRQVSGASVMDPGAFAQEYGASSLDVRHSATAAVIWYAPWKLRNLAGTLANGWMLSGIARYRSGLPYTMRTEGAIPQLFESTGAVIAGLGPGMNGYGGDDRVYGVGRNTYRYPHAWKADLRAGKRLPLGHERELELLAESFNLFNHQNVTQLERTGYSIELGDLPGSLPTLKFLTNPKTGLMEFGTPLNVNATDYYRERQMDFGMRLRF